MNTRIERLQEELEAMTKERDRMTSLHGDLLADLMGTRGIIYKLLEDVVAIAEAAREKAKL
jgi:hypothetical protein